MNSDTQNQVFAALAHPARRKILDLLLQAPGTSVKAISSHFDVSRIAVLKHLKTLEDAQLVISEKNGRVRKLWFNVIPIQQIYDRWTTRYSSFWAERVTDIQARVETKKKGKKKHA